MVIQDSSEPGGEILAYETEVNAARLTSAQIADLFQVSSKNAAFDPKDSYAEGGANGEDNL